LTLFSAKVGIGLPFFNYNMANHSKYWSNTVISCLSAGFCTYAFLVF
jgi:hypothetical protein